MATEQSDDAFTNILLDLAQRVNSAYAPYLSGQTQSTEKVSINPSLNPGAQASSKSIPTRSMLASDSYDAGTDLYYKTQEPGAVGDDKNNGVIYDNARNRLKGPLQEILQTPDWGTQLNELQNNNFAKQARYGNLNNKPYKNTLFLSRLADAFNNNRRWVPTETGYRTNSKFGTQAAKVGYSERWEPITTQETRQMRANEAIDSAQRQQDVQLQAAINKYPLDVQRTIDSMSQQLASAMGQDALSFKRSILDAIEALSYADPSKLNLNMIMQTYLQYMSKEVNIDAITAILNYLEENPLLTNVYLNSISGVNGPDLMQVAENRVMRDLYNMSNGNASTFYQYKALYDNSIMFSSILPTVMNAWESGLSNKQPTSTMSTNVLRKR